MERFSELFESLTGDTTDAQKLTLLRNYFQQATAPDQVWAIALMLGKYPKRILTSATLRAWACEHAAIPNWLFEESFRSTRDIIETITLLTHRIDGGSSELSLSSCIELIETLKELDDQSQKSQIRELWNELGAHACYIFNKLLTGGFRMNIKVERMASALSESYNRDKYQLIHRLMSDWDPRSILFEELIAIDSSISDSLQPYPFKAPFEKIMDPLALGSITDWQIEWKWDGLRVQLIKRNDRLYVWTMNDELITVKIPEFNSLIDSIPNGTVIDGELLAFKNGQPMDCRLLQKRLNRKRINDGLLNDIPVLLMACDLLESNGVDLRGRALMERRTALKNIVKEADNPVLKISPLVPAENHDSAERALSESRKRGCTGLILKRKTSFYSNTEYQTDWLTWKSEPYSVAAVLTFVQRGHDKNGAFMELTFGLWQNDELITFTKTRSGLSESEMHEIDAFVKSNTLDQFGPVRQVKPLLVFEIEFEGISPSARHKSEVVVRNSRVTRWHRMKDTQAADQLDTLRNMIQIQMLNVPQSPV